MMEQIFLFILRIKSSELKVQSSKFKEKPHLYTRGREKQYKDYEKKFRRLEHTLNADFF